MARRVLHPAAIAMAWAPDAVGGEGPVTATNDEIDGQPVVIFWQQGESSALDTGDIASGRDVGTAGVFYSTLDGQELTFEARGETFVDTGTSSTWNNLGGGDRRRDEGCAARARHLCADVLVLVGCLQAGPDLVEVP